MHRIYRIILILLLLSLCRAARLNADLRVFPRILTPGSPPGNERIFFEFSDFDEPKPNLSIFDITGRKITDIAVLNPQAVITGWRIFWDGTDSEGTVVLPGVYIYIWNAAGKATVGTVIVAR